MIVLGLTYIVVGVWAAWLAFNKIMDDPYSDGVMATMGAIGTFFFWPFVGLFYAAYLGLTRLRDLKEGTDADES